MQLSLARLSWKAQIGIFLTVALLMVGAFYYWWAEPKRADIEVRARTLAAMQADVDKGLATARQLPAFRQQVAELEARLDGLRAVLPEEKDVGDLLRRIQTLATQSSLQIKGFKPAPIVTRQMHAEWPITLELDGSYHNLARFFDQVARFSRIINISGIRIKSKDKAGVDSTITVECVATTFVLIEAPAKPAPGRPGAAPRPAGAKAS